MTADVFHSGGQFYAEDNSSFDSLDFNKEQNARQTFPLNDRTLRSDSSAVLDSSAFHLDREILKSSADSSAQLLDFTVRQFSGSRRFSFSSRQRYFKKKLGRRLRRKFVDLTGQSIDKQKIK
jgi:hypothetical protein